LSDRHVDTAAVHAGKLVLPANPASSPALFQASSYEFADLDEVEGIYAGIQPGAIYGRMGGPNAQQFEGAIAELEGTEDAVGAAAGMSAIDAALRTNVRAGDAILASDGLYGGTYVLLEKDYREAGIRVVYVDQQDPAAVVAALERERPKVFFIEALTNPLVNVADLPALAAAAHALGALLVVDATLATPVLVRPAAHGADLVVHSVGKYLGGHGDVGAGVLAGRPELIRAARSYLIRTGATLPHFEAWLAVRGLRTLALRMERHVSNAALVAAALARDPHVTAVHHPSLAGHPQHALAARLYPRGTGGSAGRRSAVPGAENDYDRSQPRRGRNDDLVSGRQFAPAIPLCSAAPRRRERWYHPRFRRDRASRRHPRRPRARTRRARRARRSMKRGGGTHLFGSARFFAAVACAGSLAACGNNSGSSSSSSSTASADASSAADAGPKTIGVSIQNREAQFYEDMEAGMKSEAAKYGYTVTVVDASRDNSKQQSQVEDFISQKVAAIVLTPYDSQAIGSAIVEANNAKIPVFTADIANGSKQGVVVAHIASNNVQGGGQAAKLVCAALGSAGGGVAIIDEPEVTSVQDRVKGFKAGLAAGCPSAKIVADIDGGGERAKANSAMEDILQSHKDLKAVFGINDDSALGASRAVDAAGLKGKVAVVGYDATPEARTAIKSGSMYGDAIQHPDQIGSKTIDAIHLYFAGGKPAAIISVPVGTFTKASAK
jgi:cystathionine gamma-synthase